MAVSGNYHWMPNGTIQQTSGGTEKNTQQTKKNNDVMGKEQFLQLLVAQLRYQDPLNPMEDKEFIAQTAQFSALEQMVNLNRAFESVQASNYLGKHVIANDPKTGVLTEGIVTETKYIDGEFKLVVNNEKEFALKDIQNITDDALGYTSLQQLINMGRDLQMFQTTSLLGKKVVALDTSTADGQDTIEGTVTEVKLVNNVYKIIVDGKEVELKDIQKVTSS